MIGIIFADSNEIIKFKYKLISSKKINQFTFNIYKINQKKIVIVHSGIGIANAAAATQELISSFKVNEIYNYGAVGGDKKVDVFDLITPEKIYYHDVLTPWYSRGQIPNEKKYYKNALSLNKTFNLASGSSFLFNKDQINEIQKDIDANIFDMETAAISQVCDKNNIKLSVIKCVSDLIGKDGLNLENINIRIQKASKLAFEKTIEIIINHF